MNNIIAVLLATAVSTAAVAAQQGDAPATNKFPRVHVDPTSTTKPDCRPSEKIPTIKPLSVLTIVIPKEEKVKWTEVPLFDLVRAVEMNPMLVKSPEVIAALVSSVTKFDMREFEPGTIVSLLKIGNYDVVKALVSKLTICDVNDIRPETLSELLKVENNEIHKAIASAITKCEINGINLETLVTLLKIENNEVRKAIIATITTCHIREIKPETLCALLVVESEDVFKAIVSSFSKMTYSEGCAILSNVLKISVKGTSRENTIPVTFHREKWYETNFAPGGSRLWAIIQKARIAAEKGEDLTKLHRAFIQTFNEWILED